MQTIMLSYLKTLSEQTPLPDKVLIPVVVLASGLINNFNLITGVLIGLVTLITIVFRALIAWMEYQEKKAERKRKAESASDV